MLITKKDAEANNVSGKSLMPIEARYLLCVGITCYRDAQGHRYFDQLWFKDLIEHLSYIEHLILASPCQQVSQLPANVVAVEDHPLFANVEFVDLPAARSLADAILYLPITIAKLAQAIQKAELVHSGVAGWPMPPGWITTPIAKLLKKPSVIIVESAFWRLQPGTPVTITSALRAQISETFNRWCVNATDLAIFTHEEYKASLLTKQPERGHIIYCSWIDQEQILSDVNARELWQKKVPSASGELKLLFAGRLTASKGVLVLLQAMNLLDDEDIPVQLDILGQGELFDQCVQASQQPRKAVKIRALGTVSYGAEFFELMQNYHALVIPTISDEGHRVVYDAYSQALPVLASDTVGLREIVHPEQTGRLIPPESPSALADTCKWALQNLNELERMGVAALKVACSLTHKNMHQQRWQLLQELLNSSKSRRSNNYSSTATR